MNYTIIAYKPSNTDYCRGCFMASYSSEFDMLCTDDRGEAVQFIVDKHKANEKHESREADYDITLLIDGKEPAGVWVEQDGKEGGYWDESVQEHAQAILDEAKTIANRTEAEAKAAAAAAEKLRKEAEAARAVAAREEHDRNEYERLKAKYEE
jgi:hypothetical protein